MNLEEQLRQGMASLTETLRETSARHIADATEALVAAAGAEQAAAVERAAADARAVAEAAAAEMLANAEQRALQQGREQGTAEGRQLGRDEGIEEGLKRGREEGLAEADEMVRRAREESRQLGHDEGIEAGLKRGRQERLEETEEMVRRARDEGHAAGLAKGREDGQAVGLAAGREQGWNEGFEKGLGEGHARGHAEGRDAGFAEGRVEGIELGLSRARQEASAQRQADSLAAAASLPEIDAGERLLEGLRLIDDAGSLSSILDALTTSASRESARAGVLLVTGDRLRGWRFVGFGTALDEASGFELSVAESGIVREAMRTRGAALGDSADVGVTPSFAALPPGRQVLAVPIAMSGQVVAVLYADQGSDQPGGNDRLSVHTLDALVRHAARCLESVTAVRAVQLATSGRRPAAAAPVVSPDDERESARRYARLLVSEIKMDNEAAVLVGQSARDLTTRLGVEIARAQALYDQRVPDHIRRERDYFDDELVATLADGDATLLGDGR